MVYYDKQDFKQQRKIAQLQRLHIRCLIWCWNYAIVNQQLWHTRQCQEQGEREKGFTLYCTYWPYRPEFSEQLQSSSISMEAPPKILLLYIHGWGLSPSLLLVRRYIYSSL